MSAPTFTDRDALAELVNGRPLPTNPSTVGGIYERDTAYERADAIIADGWVKPRVITTTDELAAVKDGTTCWFPTVGVAVARVWEWQDDGPQWFSGGSSQPMGLRSESNLPAIVLWEPQP